MLKAFLLISFISCSLVQAAVGKTFVRGCYFTNWSQYRLDRAKFLPSDYIPGLCTHIFYAFVSMNKQTYVAEVSDPADLPSGNDEGMFAKLNAVKKVDPQVKTLLSFGGAAFGTWPWNDMASTAERRAIFVNSSMAMIKEHGFDGVDIDWEFPYAGDTGLNALLGDFMKAFEADAALTGKPRLLVTAAVGAGPDTMNNAYNYKGLAKVVDFVNVMTYDFHGAWQSETGENSPLYARTGESDYENQFNINFAAKRWVQEGLPKEKVIVGIGTYGRGWTLQSTSNTGIKAPASGPSDVGKFTGEKGYAAYYELCDMLADGAKRSWEPEQKVPYLVYGNQWYGYDDVESVSGKMDWIIAEDLGGAFVWALDLDDFNGKCPNGNGKKYPLIGTIANKLAGWVAP